MSAMALQAMMKLDASGFSGPLSGVRSMLGGTIGHLAALAGVGGGVAGIFAGLKNALNLGGTLQDLALKATMPIKDLVILRQAFEDTGVGAEQGMQAITLMQRALGGISEDGQPTNKMFAQLGLSMEKLKTMGAQDQLQAIGKAISSIKDPSQQTAAAMGIFGRSGAAMKQFFADPGAIAQVTKSLGSMPAFLQANAPLLDSIGDTIGRLKTKLQGFFSGVMVGLAPGVKALTDALDKIDFTAIGAKIGNMISLIVEAFKEGQVGNVLYLSLKVGFGNFLNWATEALTGTRWDIVDVDAASAQLATITSKLQSKVNEEAARIREEAKLPGATGGSATGTLAGVDKTAMKIDADRLAKIGGFIGGGGSPATAAATKTAENTARMRQTLERMLANQLSAPQGQMAWAT